MTIDDSKNQLLSRVGLLEERVISGDRFLALTECTAGSRTTSSILLRGPSLILMKDLKKVDHCYPSPFQFLFVCLLLLYLIGNIPTTLRLVAPS